MVTLRDAMNALSDALTASVEATAGISHNLAKGEMREARVRDGLRRYIPGRYELSTGLVINRDGVQSRQQDIIISDAVSEAPFFASGGLGAFPIEATHAVIEVKSQATTSTVRDAVQSIQSLKALQGDEQRGVTELRGAAMTMGMTTEKPFGGIVCLERVGSPNSIFEAFVEANLEVPRADRTNALVVLGEFVTMWTAANGAILPSPLDAAAVQLDPVGKDALLLFYLSLRESLHRYHPPPLDLLGYINSAGGFSGRQIDYIVIGEK